MSINWVMKSPGGESFVKLPNERILYTSPPRTSLQVSTPSSVAGSQPFAVKSDSGIVYITNQRIVYLPANPTPELQSFSSPILNLQDTYVRAPFFGANYWTALCKPVPEGGIPPNQIMVELRFTFKEGGAFDFHSLFEQIKERVHEAYTTARESGQEGVSGVNMANVHLEQLPAYAPAEQAAPRPERDADAPVILSPIPRRPSEMEPSPSLVNTSSRVQQVPAPDEPPPGYEEAQMDAVGAELDRRMREEAERQ